MAEARVLSERETLAAVEDVLRFWGRRVHIRLLAFLDAPDDVEAAHRLRTSIRTLRSLISFLSPFLSGGVRRRLQGDLRSVVVETSRLREYDVLLKQVAALGEASGELTEAIAAARAAERDRVTAVLGSRDVRRLMRRARRETGDLPWRGRVMREGLSQEVLRARFDELVARVDDGFALVNPADHDATHSLRKDAKRVRYVAEFLGELLGEGAEEEAGRKKAAQDRLGEVCDARMNAVIVREFPRAGLSGEACSALDELLRENEAFVAEFLRSWPEA